MAEILAKSSRATDIIELNNFFITAKFGTVNIAG